MKYLLIILLFCSNAAFSQSITPRMTSEQVKAVQKKITAKLGRYPNMFATWMSESERKIQLTRVTVTASQNRIHLYFNEPFGQIGMREDLISGWEQMVRDTLGKGFEDCRVQLYCKTLPVERLVPNAYRKRIEKDETRKATPSKGVALTRKIDAPTFAKGLSGRHIALWASHGNYYDRVTDSWIWQRPAMFGSIEDLNTFEYCYRYLIPMLENAGAVILTPRERDPNPREIIVDEKESKILTGDWHYAEGGFAPIERLTTENPFEKGTHLATKTGGSVEYNINAPKGEYALYVSYQAKPTASYQVEYAVEHGGGKTKYTVNQRIGSGWIYLGTHVFDSGSKVTVSGKGDITTDAVRIGGGIGNVERGGKVSGLPRWAEGARYSMQWNGVPSSLYASATEEKKMANDYVDDFKSRGDWAAWMQQEKGVPIDAVVALHTNAGVNDTIFGTLLINTSESYKGKYPDGKSKMAARDMADLVMTQIVDDIRAKYTKQWTRRSLYDKSYSETFRPAAPSIIVELLSHQNMNDMLLALDPAFRFDVSRAIYKGILRFLAERYSLPYVVQPLAPADFAMKIDNDKLMMSWSETIDPLEATAKADRYKLYTRLGDGGFDDGTMVFERQVSLPIVRDGKVRSYKVTALNEGGESFPSEILSSCFLDGSKKIAMVVNSYTRLSPPDTVKGGLDFRNFVPYQHDLGIVGVQRDFDRMSKFVDNNNPGWGASTLDLATKGIAGNTFDYTMKKGAALIAEGYSYISSSKSGYDIKHVYDRVVIITERLP